MVMFGARIRVLTRAVGGPISAAPLRRGALGGLLIEIVETREGMRGRRPRVAMMFARRASVLEALVWVYPKGVMPLGIGLG